MKSRAAIASQAKRHCMPLLWLVACALLLAGRPAAAGEIWLDVDTGDLTLSVMDDGAVLRTYEGIAIGRGGVTTTKLLGDQKTPLGTYHIRRIKTDSQFYLFFGFDYPNLEQATVALQAHRISTDDWRAINMAHQQGREPPANTPLGGYLGIHGIGSGDPQIHEDFNWTEGCIAVTNEQLEELAPWVYPGMRVKVR